MDGGCRVVLTRERERNRDWAERLAAAGVAFRELPLLRFEELAPEADIVPAGFDWILFTSPQGVRAFAALGPDVGHARVAGLGSGTASALAECGWRDALDLAKRDGVEFVAAFLERVPDPGRVLLPGPKRRIAAPLEMLAAAGAEVREMPLYRTVPVPAAELPVAPCTDDDIVFFCSPSAVRAFAGAWDARPRCVAIGETSAAAAREAGFDPAVAATPDLEAMVEAAGLPPLATRPETASPKTESGS